MDTQLIERTKSRAKKWFKRWPNSAILWSGGKDSTALLHFLKFKCDIHLPVIQFREPAFRERYAFSDALIANWNLEVYDYPPVRVAFADGPDVNTGVMRFDLLKYFQWGGRSVALSLGTERPDCSQKYLCGLEFLNRPTGTFNWPWEAAFIGTKTCDTDPIKGDVPLAQDIRYAEGSPVSLYLLSEWTDEDVFGYLEKEGQLIDLDRYEKVNGKWGHKADKSKNADYIPTCVSCVNRHESAHVFCPKMDAVVSNISHLAPYEDLVFPDLGFKPVWNTNNANT